MSRVSGPRPWSPMSHTTLASLAPWKRYTAELSQRRAPISDEARGLAVEVLRQVEVFPERVGQLAQDCIERDEQGLLLDAAKRAGDRGQVRAWSRLLSEVILARRSRWDSEDG